MSLQIPQQYPLSQVAQQKMLNMPPMGAVSKMISTEAMQPFQAPAPSYCCPGGGLIGLMSEFVGVIKQLVTLIGGLIGMAPAQAETAQAQGAEKDKGGGFFDSIKSLFSGVKDFFGFGEKGAGGVVGSIVSGIKSLF